MKGGSRKKKINSIKIFFKNKQFEYKNFLFVEYKKSSDAFFDISLDFEKTFENLQSKTNELINKYCSYGNKEYVKKMEEIKKIYNENLLKVEKKNERKTQRI